MLPGVMMPPGLMAGKFAPAILKYITSVPDTSGNGVFGNVSIGGAADDRIVVIAVSENSGSVKTLLGATLGGTPMDLVTYSGSSGGSRPSSAAIFSLLVPAGVSAPLSVSLSDQVYTVMAHIYTITGARYAAKDKHSVNSASATSLTSRLNIPRGGVAVYGFTKDETAAIAWSGATKRYDENWDTDKYSCADFSSAITVTRNETVSWSGVQECALVGAAWGP